MRTRSAFLSASERPRERKRKGQISSVSSAAKASLPISLSKSFPFLFLSLSLPQLRMPNSMYQWRLCLYSPTESHSKVITSCRISRPNHPPPPIQIQLYTCWSLFFEWFSLRLTQGASLFVLSIGTAVLYWKPDQRTEVDIRHGAQPT